MSTLTSPGLLSPPAPVYICLQPDDTRLPASPTDLRRARDAMQGNAEDLPMLVERRYFHDSDAEMAATAHEQQSLSPAQPQPQPKRNKRKNFQPRNIVCDAPESDCDCEAEVPTASAGGCGADEADEGDDGDEAARELGAQRRALDLSCSRTSPEDAPAMKEYAENTMKELLSIYGLSGADMAETITQNVPIANFSSGKILETLSLKQPVPQPQQASPPTPPRTPFSPPPASAAANAPSASSSASSAATASGCGQRKVEQPGEASAAAAPAAGQPQGQQQQQPQQQQQQQQQQQPQQQPHPLLDTLRHKAALLQQPRLPNNAHHVPQVMLPQDMATILTLAAMQDQQKAAAAAAAAAAVVPHPSGTPPSPYVLMDHSPKNGGSLLLGHRMSPLSPSRDPTSNGKAAVPIDYSRYVKRFSSALECANAYCKDLNYREHFHCLDCNSRVFVKKEEMIRHFKWHKKRDESLQHGFMRYSPMDDCSDRYRGCSHNRKQTHYHCIKEGCDKVYISTSDVQMHANYHRKDSAIIQEGFQRFRATEECGAVYCTFFGQRTTHFHCRRDNCKYTFKNKADMEKHKTYHIKDEQLSRDGFKKFMKNENCPFESCRFSRVCNHIHCIRAGCNYVLHSSGQLFSHKRKHERQDSEMAYRKFKLAQSMIKTFSEGQQGQHLSPSFIHAFSDQLTQPSESPVASIQTSVIQQGPSSVTVDSGICQVQGNGDTGSSDSGRLTPVSVAATPPSKYSTTPTQGIENTGLPSTPGHYGMSSQEQANAMDLSSESLSNQSTWTNEDFWQKYLAHYGPNEKCIGGGQCENIFKEHFHCVAEGCEMSFRSMEGVREHARNHEQQEQVSEAFYITVESGSDCQCEEECPYKGKDKHYHCTWDNCREIILPSDKPFRRLDHYKMHEYSRKLSLTKDPLTMTHLATSIDGMFRRKRGRPPKNRVIEVWNDYFPMAPGSVMDSPQAIFTSFKLPKPSTTPTLPGYGTQPNFTVLTAEQVNANIATSPGSPDESSKSSTPRLDLLQEGFFSYAEGSPCPDALCPFNTRAQHFHCSQPRCFYVTDREDILIMHSKDFHDNIDIMEGFLFFDRTVDCRLPSCHSNRVNRHFHCMRPGCGYSFVRYSTMAVHEKKHRSEEAGNGEAETESNQKSTCESSLSVQNLVKTSESSMSPVHIKSEVVSENTVPVNCSSPVEPAVTQTSALTVSSPETSLNRTTVVKASGTFYPLSAFSCEPVAGAGGKGGVPKSSWGTCPSSPPASASARTVSVPDTTKSEPCFGVDTSAQQSLTRLLQQPQIMQESPPRPDWMLPERHAFSELERLRPHIAKHSSGALSPSVIKKEVEDNNNEESSDSGNNSATCSGVPVSGSSTTGNYEQAQMLGHSSSSCEQPHPQMPPQLQPQPPAPAAPPPPLHAPVFPPHSSAAASFNAAMAAAAAAGQQFALITSQGLPFIQPGLPAIYSSPAGLMFAAPVPPPPGLHPHHHPNGLLEHHPMVAESEQAMALAAAAGIKRSMSPHIGPGGHTPLDMSPEAKKARVQNSMRILKDEPVPDGYVRFRFNEDCKYPHCGYREHQTHFHCMRSDCGYSFCDKTRFVQHTARHERLDTLMGGDFQQFRANVACGRQECVYTSTLGAMQNKASHFHCLKCEFVCTDTNKVVAHRRQHQKLDSIMAAGFEKFTPSQPCSIESCAHSGKQTHYHCLSCQYAVLGLSQMSAHKYRHME